MQTVALVLRPGFQMMSLAALSAFEFANLVAGEPLYQIRVLSEHGGLVPSSLAAGIDTEQLAGADFDTVLISGSMDRTPAPERIRAFLVEAAQQARRVGALCVGAFALAEAQLLDGRRATVHWQRAAEMRRRFPAIRLEDDRIFIVDGPIWTSAGMSSALDLTMAMVRSSAALMPAEVQIGPSTMKMRSSSSRMAGKRRRISAARCQCTVARRPSSSCASASAKAPTHSAPTRRACCAASTRKARMRSGAGVRSIEPLMRTVSKSAPASCSVSMPAARELGTSPPCSDKTRIWYSGSPATRLANSKADKAARLIIWKPGRSTSATVIMAGPLLDK